MTETHSEARPLAFIIEDDRDLASGYGVALTEAGYEPRIFLNGSLALEALATTIPAFILIDLNLPDISGEAVLRRVRADKRLVDMKIAIVSADSTWAAYLENEADIVLTKPVGFRQLRALAKRLNG
jgi:two-component system response regulator QseB